MIVLGYTLGFAGFLTAVAVASWLLGVRLVRESEEHDYPTVDFGADLNGPDKAA